jgi:hypothetical protein
MGSQTRHSLRKAKERWVPEKGTPGRRPGNHGFPNKELPKGGHGKMVPKEKEKGAP